MTDSDPVQVTSELSLCRAFPGTLALNCATFYVCFFLLQTQGTTTEPTLEHLPPLCGCSRPAPRRENFRSCKVSGRQLPAHVDSKHKYNLNQPRHWSTDSASLYLCGDIKTRWNFQIAHKNKKQFIRDTLHRGPCGFRHKHLSTSPLCNTVYNSQHYYFETYKHPV